MDEETDFHPDEEPEKQFSYAVYSDNLRHTLNMMLKKPIKKQLSNNCYKFLINVQRNPAQAANDSIVSMNEFIGKSYSYRAKVLNLTQDDWNESEIDHLNVEFSRM